jgi:hypothetical protein
MNPLPTTPSTQRTCDHCAKVLPSYEQSRRACHSCRRKQLRQRMAEKADRPTSPPPSIEASPVLPSHILQRFQYSTSGLITWGTPPARGRAILPAPRKRFKLAGCASASPLAAPYGAN